MQKITDEFIRTLTKRDILSLDVATHTGYYTLGHGYGTVYFPNTGTAPKKYGDDYQQHKAFRDWVIGMIKKHNIKIVVAEDVNVGTQFNALRKLAQFQGVLFELCATLDVPLMVENVTSIKRFATGKGNATKDEMLKAAIQKYKVDMEGDDNAGDAIHIFHYFTHKYGITK